jgi:hypothetical protein
MKRFSLLRIGALALLGLAALNPGLKADEYDRKTVISISQPLEVPGSVLPPGTYVMKLLNSSSNRHIVQFMNERQNQQLALTFAVPAERIRPAEKTLLAMYEGSGGAPPALRTWYYPGDTVGQEFLYPHQQAIRISKRTNVAVPEVETGQTTRAALAPAEPTQSNVQSSETRDEPVLVARAEPAPEPTPEPAGEPVAAPEPQQPAAETQAPAANNAQSSEQSAPAATESLPQTAGDGPLAALIGSLAFALAFGLRELRRSRIH